MTLSKARVSIHGTTPLSLKFITRSIPIPSSNNNSKTYSKLIERAFFVNSFYILTCLLKGVKFVNGSKKNYSKNSLIVLDGVIVLDHFLIENLSYLQVSSLLNQIPETMSELETISSSRNWKAFFQFEWSKAEMTEDRMKLALLYAGAYVGLGDFQYMGLGRFSVDDLIL